jgi:ComF family protein
VPVPLHRRRLWSRGFNQSAIVARELSRRTGIPVAVDALRRTRANPPLKGMGMRQRRRTVAGAFRSTMELRGQTVILVDDVLTTGSTANACARVLKRAGAGRVDLVSWARVIRPMQIDV